MNASAVMSTVSIVLGFASTAAVFRFAGKWQKSVEDEKAALGEAKAAKKCPLRVKLSFTKACRKADEWCIAMGSAAVVLLAVTLFLAMLVLVNGHLLNRASADPSATAGQSGVRPAPASTDPAASAGPSAGQRQVSSASSTNASPLFSEEQTGGFLCGVSSLMLVLMSAISVCVLQLRLMLSVMQKAREVT